MYNVRNMQTMSSDPLRVSDVMLDSLTHQLREAETRRAEAERAHQVRFFFPIWVSVLIDFTHLIQIYLN